MQSFIIFISNNALGSAIVAAAIIAVAGRGWMWWHDRRESKAIYNFLRDSKSSTAYNFRSTEAISSHTKITERRIAVLCSKHPKIRRNEKEKQSWTVVE